MMKAACLMLMASATTSAFAQKMNIEHKGDTTIIKVENPTKYLLLPIQEEKDEAQVLLDTGSKDDTWMDVRLAQNGSDYYVPFALGKGKTATVKILGLKRMLWLSTCSSSAIHLILPTPITIVHLITSLRSTAG